MRHFLPRRKIDASEPWSNVTWTDDFVHQYHAFVSDDGQWTGKFVSRLQVQCSTNHRNQQYLTCFILINFHKIYVYIYIWVCLNNFQIRIVRPYLAGLHDSLWVVDTMRFQGTWSKRWLKALPKVSFPQSPRRWISWRDPCSPGLDKYTVSSSCVPLISKNWNPNLSHSRVEDLSS